MQNEPPIDAEVVNQNQSLAVRPQMAVAQPMTAQDILGQVKLIQDVMRAVMIDGTHYGTIPGAGTKKVLLQPGAQKLTMTFRLAPEYEIQETNFEKDHKEYRVVCTLKSIQSGNFVGQGVGCCSTLESKYRFRGGSRKCPKCGKESIIKGKAEYGGGWVCFGKKGGCNSKWPDGATEIESQSIEKVENENPADCFNTALKMAKKRAFVDATITATAASDIFTQDVLDPEEEPHDAPKPPAKPATKPTPPAQPQRTIPKRDAPIATEATRNWMVDQIAAAKLHEQAFAYFVSKGMLLETESLDMLPLEFVPTSKALMAGMITSIRAHAAATDDQIPGLESPAEPEPQEPADEAPSNDVNAPNAAWRSFPLPFPGKGGTVPKGTPLGELEKKYLYGLVKNVKAETEYNGNPLSPERIAASKMFRTMLDNAGKHYGFQ